MKQQDKLIALLKEEMSMMDKSAEVWAYSYAACVDITETTYTPEQEEKLEALSSI